MHKTALKGIFQPFKDRKITKIKRDFNKVRNTI